MLPQAKEGQGLPRAARAGRGKEGPFPGACGGSRAPPTPPFGIPSFQSCERIHFHCFKPAGFWYFVTAVTERNTAPHHSRCLLQATREISCSPVRTVWLLRQAPADFS